MTYLHDGTITVSLDINWEFIQKQTNIANSHRTIGGRESNYLWGSFQNFEVLISNVPSSDAAQMNEWWMDSTQLIFVYEGRTSVTAATSVDVFLTSQSQPFMSLSPPYFDEWTGTLAIEEI